eukprot:TRINITY_DN13818_c1_g1_i5.p1 TRINITY_DN13818_c1_g1~~TRINITY_DN13818_c1_g1_i5.p1  ORF type:complete len:666 (+),score=111.75 TRINITY_DN13818_c1_g1_i5:172-1998(+)
MPAHFMSERLRPGGGGGDIDTHAFEVAQMIAADRDTRGFESTALIKTLFEVKEPSMQDPPDTFTAVHRTTGMVRRLVTIRKPAGSEQQEQLRHAVRQFQALRSESVARILEVFEDGRATSLVMEHCSGGTVYDRILQRQYFAEQETAVLIRHVLQSLSALHRHGLAHGHPTPDSFSFHTDAPHASLKLMDFGLDLKVHLWDAPYALEGSGVLHSTGQRDRRRAACLHFFETCRIVFCSPEVVKPLSGRPNSRKDSSESATRSAVSPGAAGHLDGDLLSEAIDVHLERSEELDMRRLEMADAWSVGAIAFLLLCGYPPFFAPCRYAILSRIESTDYAFDPPFWSKISEEAKDFVQQCLRASPSERMSVAEALHHPWILSLADTSPSGSMLSSFALNLRRFYRTSLIEGFAANSLAAKLSFDELFELHTRCQDADVSRSGFFTATDLRQVLMKLGLSEIAEAIAMCFSRSLRHPGESYIDYSALVDSVRTRRERLLEEELWTVFCEFADPALGGGGQASPRPEAASASGCIPLSPVAGAGANTFGSGIDSDGLAGGVDTSGTLECVGGVNSVEAQFVEVDFIGVASEVIRHLPPLPPAAPAPLPPRTEPV